MFYYFIYLLIIILAEVYYLLYNFILISIKIKGMSLLNRLENFKFDRKDNPDIEYLKNSSIGGVINRGLAELYKVQPKNPVTFLSNWLLNESRSFEIKKKVKVYIKVY